MATEKQVTNNFKYLHLIVEGYYNNPITYQICRRKRLLLLKNYHEIKHLKFLEDLLEGFICDQYHYLAVRNFHGIPVLDNKNYWQALKYHDESEVNSFIRVEGLKKPVPDLDPEFPLNHYYNELAIFKEKLKVFKDSCLREISIRPECLVLLKLLFTSMAPTLRGQPNLDSELGEEFPSMENFIPNPSNSPVHTKILLLEES